MDKNTRWRVAIFQKYTVGSGRFENSMPPEYSTQVVDLRVKAKDAQEAAVKGDAYVKAMKMENTYVGEVRLDGILLIDCTEV